MTRIAGFRSPDNAEEVLYVLIDEGTDQSITISKALLLRLFAQAGWTETKD